MEEWKSRKFVEEIKRREMVERNDPQTRLIRGGNETVEEG